RPRCGPASGAREARERVGARRAGARAGGEATEHALEEVGEAGELLGRDVGVDGATGSPERTALRVLRHAARSSVSVVELARLGAGEDRVGLVALLEALFGAVVAGVPVGVVLGCKAAEGAADLVLRGALAHPQHLVVVLVLSHRYTPCPAGAGRPWQAAGWPASPAISCPYPTSPRRPWPGG